MLQFRNQAYRNKVKQTGKDAQKATGGDYVAGITSLSSCVRRQWPGCGVVLNTAVILGLLRPVVYTLIPADHDHEHFESLV